MNAARDLSTRYFEDVRPGDTFDCGSAVMTQAEMIEFASRFDPQPIHTDPAQALHGPFGGLIASGWHTAAVVMRLLVEARPLGATPLIGMSVDSIHWPIPVRDGDTLRATVEVLSMRPSKSHPDHGILKLRVVARNQRGQTVMVQEPNCWVPRRAGGPRDSGR
jgi:acyl dehydratase